jgi:4,5-dihydroxyphthalate decarboxylase
VTRLDLTLGCGEYDRTRALADGRVQVEGVDLRYVALEPEEVFFRMARHEEFDAAEFSLSSYVVTLSHGAPFVAIPVFPSKRFRHSCIFVNSRAGIEAPADLIGRTVGIPEYQLTAIVWIRGMLAEHYRVPVSSVRYRTGGLHDAGRTEKLPVSLPPEIEISPIPSDRVLSDMLATGEIDALYSPRAPNSLLEGDGAVRCLFADPRAEERAYFAKTGIFPLMHAIVLRRDVYTAHRWLANSLVKAFTVAKDLAYEQFRKTAALEISLPWAREEYESTVKLLGPDYWAYGLEPNRHALSTFLRYAHEQYLTDRLLAPEDLFARETLETVLV